MGGTKGPETRGNVQYWFEPIKRHGGGRSHTAQTDAELKDNNRHLPTPKRSAIFEPHFGHHRQDMQGITNVEVMCCDGQDRDRRPRRQRPQRVRLRHAVYDLNYKELAHVAGGVAVRGQIEKACDTLGGKFVERDEEYLQGHPER